MNYYNPYFGYPYMSATTPSTGGLFSRLFGNGINWSSILSGTQKTLGIVNQAIPIVKQVSPVMKNAKTMFKIMNEFKKVDTPSASNTSSNTISSNKNEDATTDIKREANSTSTNNGPTFFI